MIKKILLFFMYVFISSPVIADTDRIFIEPTIAEKFINQYFGHMVSENRVPRTYLTDEIILAKVLAKWSECVKSDPDKRIATSCIVDVCKIAFGGALYEGYDFRSVGNTANDYCKKFGYDLITASAFVASNSNCMYKINKQSGSQMKIQYKTYDSSGFVRKGGSIAWRFFNPGNLRRSEVACGRIETNPSGTFAVFENYDQGRQALHNLLRSNSYSTLTIEKAINRYAPPNENNTLSYINNVKNRLRTTRSDVDTLTLKDLSDDELNVLMDIIQQIEGWNMSGEIIPL